MLTFILFAPSLNASISLAEFNSQHIRVHLSFMKSEPDSTQISDANFIIGLTNSFPISQFLFFRIFRAFLYLIILTWHFVQKWNDIYSKKELNVVISEKYWTFGRDCFIIFDYQRSGSPVLHPGALHFFMALHPEGKNALHP